MIDDTNPAFEFDPLPGAIDGKDVAVPDLPVRKKRGRKAKVKKAVRAKRGPRKVAPHIEARAKVVEQIVAQASRIGKAPDPGLLQAELEAVKFRNASPIRKKRKVKTDPPELTFIQLLIPLSNKQRRRVVDVLNKIFPV